MKRNYPLLLTRGALIAALYTVFTLLSSLFGLSGGIIQLRLGEMLTILPVLLPEAIFGLTIGCLVSNILTGAMPLDILLGTLATLIGALGAYFLRRLPQRLISIAALPTILANSIIIPPLLAFTYGSELSLPLIFLSVFIGEFISAGIFGTILYYYIKKTKLI